MRGATKPRLLSRAARLRIVTYHNVGPQMADLHRRLLQLQYQKELLTEKYWLRKRHLNNGGTELPYLQV